MTQTLRNKSNLNNTQDNFWSLVLANTLLRSGLWLSFMAVLVQIQNTMELALSLAYAIILKRFPAVLASYPGGKLADTRNPKVVVLIVVGFTAGLSLLLSRLNFHNTSYYPWLLLGYTLISAAEGLYRPSMQALNARVHSQQPSLLRKTNIWINASGMLSVVVMGALGALLHMIWSVNFIFTVSAGFILLAFLSLLSIKVMPQITFLKEAPSADSFNSSKLEKNIPLFDQSLLNELSNSPLVRMSFIATSLLGLVYAFFSLIVTKFPFDIYANNQVGVAVANSVVGLGVLLSVFILRMVRQRGLLTSGKVFSTQSPDFDLHYILMFLMGLFLFIFSQIQSFIFGMGILTFIIAIYGVLKLQTENQLLAAVPAHHVGRVFSLLYIVEEFAITPALLIYAYHCKHLGVDSVGVGVGEFVMICSVLLALFRLENPNFSRLKTKILINHEKSTVMAGLFRLQFFAFIIISLLLINGLLSLPLARADYSPSSLRTATSSNENLQVAIRKLEDQLRSWQNPSGYWWVPAYQGSHLISQYFILNSIQGISSNKFDPNRLKQELVSQVLPEGGWSHLPLSLPGRPELDASILNYWALKIMGEDPESELMTKARKIILSLGGIEMAEASIKITLALAGILPWDNIPKVSNIFFNTEFLVNHRQFAPWVEPAMYGINYLRKREKIFPLAKESWAIFELSRSRSQVIAPGAQIKDADEFLIKGLLRTQSQSGLWAMSTVASQLNVIALEDYLAGFAQRTQLSRLKSAARRAQDRIAELYFSTGNSAYKGVSFEGSYWDTLLTLRALSYGKSHKELDVYEKSALDYVLRSQHAADGSFHYGWDTKEYPDLDDTALAAIVLAKLEEPSLSIDKSPRFTQSCHQALTWMGKMQDDSGAWSSFSKNRSGNWLLKTLSSAYSHESTLFDGFCADIVGHVLEAYGANGINLQRSTVVQKAVDYLLSTQNSDGTWSGCWGINYVYGTSAAISGLLAVGVPLQNPALQQALNWLESLVQSSGGVADTFYSYANPAQKGKGTVTATQSAWALQALVDGGRASSAATQRIVDFLVDKTLTSPTLEDPVATGTAVGGLSYMVYPVYAPSFSLLALKHFRAAMP